VTSGENADETGIVVAGVDGNKHGYVLDDLSGRYAPSEWAAEAIHAFRRWKADRIIAEINNGGEMIENTIRMVDPNVPIKTIHASRGKVTRAEPVSALFEQHRVHHVGSFPTLEDQMCEFTSDFDRSRAGYSPDRVDALVWALTELIVEGRSPMIISDAVLARARSLGPMSSPYSGERPYNPPRNLTKEQLVDRAFANLRARRGRGY
jgi:predicted phage terminase large subunit-like protein